MNIRARWLIAALTFCAAGPAGAPTLAQAPNGPKQSEGPATADKSAQPPSEAEKIARLQRAITDGETQIQQITADLNNPQSEFNQAEQSFRQLDETLTNGKRALEKLKEEGIAESVIATAELDYSLCEKRRGLAKERFDLAIEKRRTSQANLAALEQKLQEDKAALAKLVSPTKPADAAAGQPPASPGTSGAPASPPGAQTASGAAPTGGASETQTSQTPPSSAAPQPSDTTGAALPSAPPVGAPVNGAAPPAASDASAKPVDRQVAKAQEALTSREAEVREAEAQSRSIETRIAALRESIAAERKLLKTAQQLQDNSNETKRVLNEELQTRWGAGATWADLRELREKVAEADQRIAATRKEIRERSDRLDDLQSQLNELQADEIAAAEEAEGRRQDAEAARRKLAELSNPFSPANLLQWVLDHGPKILGIILGMVALLTLARVLERKLVPIIARHSRGAAGGTEDRENRARTLLGVFHNTVRIVVVVGGGMMLLTELGMNILPLITAAGVVGLAVAFGAQNLIRDYFYGFIILLESQYTINDVVRIGGISGMVERITLRITVLRDLEGIVHFIPHGEIKAVSNLTHGWSRALFDIGIAYKESPDQAMKVLIDLGKEIRRDPEYSALILDDPEMLGVDQLGDSAVVIKFLIKTRPLKQWVVKREMLRRIKNKFDELGIEIPFPHRTVYHRHEAADESEPKTPRLPQWEEGPYVNR